MMLNRINEGTKTHKLFTALKSGETITPAAAEKRFGIKNVSAEVSRIAKQAMLYMLTHARQAMEFKSLSMF